MTNKWFACGGATLLLFQMSSATLIGAEIVELKNGETLRGQLVSVNARALTFNSETLGNLSIDREKVAAIFLVEDRFATSKSSSVRPSPSPQVSNENELLKGFPSVQDVLKQLQTDGLPNDAVSDLKKQFPMLENPEVKEYFMNRVGGLMLGRISIDDIRNDAIDARDQIRDLEKDLGPQASRALEGYLSILDGFIQETAPTTSDRQKSTDRDRPTTDDADDGE